MTPASRVEAVLFAALEKPTTAERNAFLDSACAGDAELRRQVEKLLQAHANVGDFLQKPVGEQLAAAAEPADATQEIAATDGPGAGPRGRTGLFLARTEGAGASDEDSALDFLQPSTRPNSLGRLGHYEVLEVLGRGGFGIVFRAFDESLQRVVAIKVLVPEIAATSPARKRFLREARASAMVQHDNIVQVFAVEEEPLPHLVMEFVPGETLQQRLDRNGPLEVLEVVRLGRQIAEGLGAAHDKGLIHRDVKPGNILIEIPSPPTPLPRWERGEKTVPTPRPRGARGECGRVKITDFGLARAADDASMSQSGMIAGTPMYMAPEQASADVLDHRADLFSLGSVLYTMCSGRPPFRAPSTLAVLKRVAEDTPRPIREIIPEVPQWLCDLIARLHAKKPEDRIATAREVAELLDRGLAALLQSPGSVKPPFVAPPAAVPRTPPVQQSPEAAPTSKRRSGIRRWLGAAAVLLVLLGGLGITEATGLTNVRGTVIRLFSPEGTLVVEVDDPGVSVKIDGSEIVITGAGAKEIRLKPGRYTVEATKDGKLVSRELVAVTKNGRQLVRVSQEPSDTETPPVQGKLPPTYKNGIGMEFVVVPKGKSWLGGGKVKLDANEVAIPADFYLGKYEVTQEEWQKVMGENPSIYSRTGRCRDTVKDVPDADLKRFPVDSVSWDQCQLFMAKLNQLVKETGWVYRLPTEVEWEYACRGGPMSDRRDSAFDFYLAKPTNTLLPEQANFDRGDGSKGPCKVGSYAANVLGLHDMHGNVWEWCDANVDQAMPAQRGGDWNNPPEKCRAADRWDHPRFEQWWTQGLRVARVPSGDPSPAAKTTAHNLDRRAAYYVLSIGGGVRINDEDRGVQAVTELPQEPFRLTAVGLDMNKQVTDAGLSAFEGCTNLNVLSLYGCGQITDRGLAHFKDCKGLTTLELEGVSVTDTGLAPFKNYKNLKHLHLGNTQVTDAGLAYLKDLKNLTSFQLLNQPVTDAGLAQLKDCKNLIHLDLRSTRVTDAGLAYFKDCKDLTTIWASGTSITDAGLAVLKDCQNLAELDLGGTSITDEGLAHLKGHKKLAGLHLNGTSVTEAGLAHLAGLNGVTALSLGGTKVSDAGLAHLKGMPLRLLVIHETGITDLTPLQGMTLEDIRLTPKNITKGLDMLRDMKSLKTIGIGNQAWPAAEFWERYGKGEFKE